MKYKSQTIMVTAGEGKINGQIKFLQGPKGEIYLTVLDKSDGASGKHQTVILSQREAAGIASILTS